MDATLTPQAREAAKFDELALHTGESWWGHTTPAGAARSRRRGTIVAAEIADLSDPYVLEFGCGTGVYTRAILEQRPDLRLIGSDISPASIKLAEQRFAEYSAARFEVQDVTALSHADGTFDLVTGNSILHHVPIEQSLAEAFRVLKPGGRLLFFEPNMLNPELAFWHNIPKRLVPERLEYSDDERPFTRWAARHFLEQAGFTQTSSEPFDFLHPLVPSGLVDAVERASRLIEKTPLIREISGSQIVRARKPS